MTNEMLAILKAHGAFQYAVVDTGAIHFSDEVRKLCEANACRQYGRTWSCPPAVGTVEECKARCLSYEHMLVFTGKYDLEDSFDFEGMTEGMRRFKQLARALDADFKALYEDGLMLANEGCDICAECTYPSAPCRFPEKAHGSIEGYGIFVNELAEAAGINYINGVNTVTYFGGFLF